MIDFTRKQGESDQQYSTRLKNEHAAELAAQKVALEASSVTKLGTVSAKVAEKSKAISVYGVGQRPVTLYPQQWLKVLQSAPAILQFIWENQAACSFGADAEKQTKNRKEFADYMASVKK